MAFMLVLGIELRPSCILMTVIPVRPTPYACQLPNRHLVYDSYVFQRGIQQGGYEIGRLDLCVVRTWSEELEME